METGTFSLLQALLDPASTAQPEFREMVRFNTRMKGPHVVGGNTMDRGGRCRTDSGRNGGHLLVVSPEVRDTVMQKAVYAMAAVDQEGRVLWNEVLELQERSAASEMLAARLDDEGNAWVLVRVERSAGRDGGAMASDKVELFHVGPGGARSIRPRLEGEQYIKQALLERRPDGRLFVAGVLAMPAPAGTVTGDLLFVAPLPETPAELTDLSIVPMPAFESRGKVPARPVLRHAFQDKEGTSVLVIEDSEYARVQSPGSKKPEMKHVHGTVQVVGIRGGREAFSTTHRTLLHLDAPHIGNVLAIMHRNTLSLFMLDTDKLAAKRSDEKAQLEPADHKSLYSTQVSFDPRGKKEVRRILVTDSGARLIAGRAIHQVGAERFIAFTTSKADGAGFLPVQLVLAR
jgi:hypothetical protein